MNEIQIRYLSHEDIISMDIDFSFVVDTVKKVLIKHANGFYVNPKKPNIDPTVNSFFHAMPAYLPRLIASWEK